MRSKRVLIAGMIAAMLAIVSVSQVFAEPFGQNVTYASSPSEIVTSSVSGSASSLTADEANATTITMSDDNSQVKIDSAGTYIVTGKCSDGNITVKKNTTGVVLILKDLDLTSTTGATVSCNKYSQVKIIIRGTVKLTDAEDPADEDSTDETVADAFDGAALKAKDGSDVYLTGTGTLNIDSSSCKNGIKVGDEGEPSFVIEGGLTVSINAANDGINAGYDMTILSGTVNITAGDDGIHADHILTIGKSGGSGPSISIKKSYEGLEGTVVNLFGGTGIINASDDAVNAANKDGLYESILTYSINITGGTWNIRCSGDGLDSNGNINITGGSTTINSGSTGGEAGIDYDGSLYVANGTLNNNSGIAGPDNMGGMPGQQGTQMPGQQGTQMPGQMPGQQGSKGQAATGSSQTKQPWNQIQVQQSSTIVFPDVADSSKSYYKPVYWAAANGITLGYKNGNFGPEDPCTRAQFVTFLWRMAGKPAAASTVSFSDVSSDMSAYRAIQWAVEEGIIVGYKDGTFRPSENVTRRQVATMLWRWSGRPSAGTDANAFADMDESDSSYNAVMWGSSAGVIKGAADSSGSRVFKPSDNCQRQQIVTFLYRYAREILGINVG